MIPRDEQDRLRSLVVETVSLLCKSRLNCKAEFSIDGLLGITVDNDDVFLVSFKETVKSCADGSSSVDSGYAHKPSHKKRRLSASREADPLDSDYTVSVGSRMESLEDSEDSSMSDYEYKSILSGSNSRTPIPDCRGAITGSHSLTLTASKPYDDPLQFKMEKSSENVIVIKEESLSDEEYFAAQDLNIGHDVTVSSDIGLAQRGWSSSNFAENCFLQSEIKTEAPDLETLSTSSKTKTSVNKQSSKQKKSRSTGVLSTVPGSLGHQAAMTEAAAPGGEFFSFFASQYNTNHVNEHHDDIIRLILTFPGPYVSVRNIRRKYPRYTTDLYVSSMIQMTVPRDSQNYVGELRFLPSRVKVFYKCPPGEMSSVVLEKYCLTQDGYEEAFGCASGGGREEESPAYHRAIMEYSPFEDVAFSSKSLPLSSEPSM